MSEGMNRFFWASSRLAPGLDVDLAELHHQMWRVLRIRPGNFVVLLDNRGHAFRCEVKRIDRHGADARVLEEIASGYEPQIALTLFQCVLKGDKFAWVLQKGTELGVHCFVPVMSLRTVPRISAQLDSKFTRWQTIIREAAEQCGRARLPLLSEPVDFAYAARRAEGLRLLPWEEAGEASGVRSTLTRFGREASTDMTVSLMVGPEGGLDVSEVDLARQQGWQVVTLGKRVLRSETAALASIAMIMDWACELGT